MLMPVCMAAMCGKP